MSNLSKRLANELNYDPVARMEEISGRRGYSGDNALLLLALAADHSRRKRELLEDLDDTGFNNTLENYQRIIGKEGFQKVLELDFIGKLNFNDAERQEKFFIYWNPEGLLIVFDTFDSTDINAAKLYYQVIPSKGFEGSSGSMRDGVWCGDHDAREALRHKLTNIRQHCQILSVWKHRMHMWLLHYMDTNDENGNDLPHGAYDCKAINRERVAMLPENVRGGHQSCFRGLTIPLYML